MQILHTSRSTASTPPSHIWEDAGIAPEDTQKNIGGRWLEVFENACLCRQECFPDAFWIKRFNSLFRGN
jgi:hypothetical protein